MYLEIITFSSSSLFDFVERKALLILNTTSLSKRLFKSNLVNDGSPVYSSILIPVFIK